MNGQTNLILGHIWMVGAILTPHQIISHVMAAVALLLLLVSYVQREQKA